MACAGLLRIEVFIYGPAPSSIFGFCFFFLALTFIFLLPPCTISLDRCFIRPICFLNSPSETLLLHYFCVSYLHLASGTPSVVFGPQSELDRKSDIKQVKEKQFSFPIRSVYPQSFREKMELWFLCLYLLGEMGFQSLGFLSLFWHLQDELPFANHINHSGSQSPDRKC